MKPCVQTPVSQKERRKEERERERKIRKIDERSWALVAHTCNPSYLGG
jgi:hypothetical protein